MMSMNLILVIVLLVLVASVQPSHAQNWRPVERQCWADAQTAARPPCGSCSGQWREVAQCVLTRSGVSMPADTLYACFNAVNRSAQNQPMSYDRVADVIRCVGR
jgi:hypothetical protein